MIFQKNNFLKNKMARIKEEIFDEAIKINFDIKKELNTIVIKKENEIFRFTIEEIKNKIEEGWFIQSVQELKVFTTQNKNLLKFKKEKKHGIVVRIADFAVDNTFYELFTKGFNTFEVEIEENKRYIYRSETEFDVLVNLYRVNQIHRCKIYGLKEDECKIPLKWNEEKEIVVENKGFRCSNPEIENKDISENIVIFRIKNNDTFFCADRYSLTQILNYDVNNFDNMPIIEQTVSTKSITNITYLLKLQLDKNNWIYKIPYIEVYVDKSLITVLEKNCNTISLFPLKQCVIFRSLSESGLHDVNVTVFKAREEERKIVFSGNIISKFNFHLDLRRNKNSHFFVRERTVAEIINQIENKTHGGDVDVYMSYGVDDHDKLNEVYQYFIVRGRINSSNVPSSAFTEEFCEKLINLRFANIESIPSHLITKNLIKKVIRLRPKGFDLISYIPEDICDSDFIMFLINENPRWIFSLPSHLVNHKHKIQSIIKDPTLIKELKPEKRDQVIMEILKIDPYFIFELEESTPEMQKFAISNNGLILEELDEETMSQEMVNLAIENNAKAIEFVPEKFLNSKTIIKALNKDPKVISLVNPKFITENVVNFYVYETKNWNLKFIPIQFRTKEICQLAFDKDEKQMEFIPDSIRPQIQS